MNQTISPNIPYDQALAGRDQRPDCTGDEIHLTDLLLVLLKRKRMILILCGLAFLCSALYSLLLPSIYTATARILPPVRAEAGFAGIYQAAGAFEDMGISIGAKSGAEVFVGMLESRTVADTLIDRFNLHEVYDEKLKEALYRRLAGLTKIQISRKTQIITVSVDDKDPRLAAELANGYVDALDEVNRRVSNTEGRRKRLFLEDRLEKVKKDLLAAEMAHKKFQEEHRLIAIDAQAKAAIEGAARIKGEIIAAQTELEVLKQFGTVRQNEAIMLRSKIGELENQLARIESGRQEKTPLREAVMTKETSNFYIPFSELPELGLQLARLSREARTQEKVFELLTSQCELAKIEEAKDVNTIQILDRAVPPDMRSKPKRRVIVVLSAVVAVFLGVFLAFFLEYVDRLKIIDKERYHQIAGHLSFRKRR
ncbi:MAG: Wzz/FepE/Etk N-terminal domain-containing protein [Thermodesulfobacteriota bacterium]